MIIKKPTAAIKNSLITVVLFFIFALTQSYADLSVGDSYGGGTVFCVSPTPDITKCVPYGSGKYGLIMANEDQANFDSNPQHGVTWAAESKMTGAVADDDGAANSAAIIATYLKDNPSNNAAWLCRDYRDPEGHTDWYLPSKNELNKIYLYAKANNLIGRNCAGSKPGGVQCLIGGFNERWKGYCSSTEYPGDYSYAWSQYFVDGDQGGSGKDVSWLGVRAVRAFINLSIQPFNNLPKPKSTQGVGLAVPAVPPKDAVKRFIHDAEETGNIDIARLL